MAVIYLPRQLKAYANDLQEIEISGKDIQQVLAELVLQYPLLKPYIFKNKYQLVPFINFYLNGKNIRYLNMSTAVNNNDKLEVIPASSGG